MATIQKTTLKRYNGTDWDPVYLANSADISYLGAGFTVAEIDAAVATATHTNRAVLDALSESTVGTTDYLAYDGNELAYLSEVQQVALGALQIVSSVPATAANGQFLLEEISGT